MREPCPICGKEKWIMGLPPFCEGHKRSMYEAESRPQYSWDLPAPGIAAEPGYGQVYVDPGLAPGPQTLSKPAPSGYTYKSSGTGVTPSSAGLQPAKTTPAQAYTGGPSGRVGSQPSHAKQSNDPNALDYQMTEEDWASIENYATGGIDD